MAVIHRIACGFLFTVLVSGNLAADEGSAKCEILDSGTVHCSNIRSKNGDYLDSIDNLLPDYLDYAALTKGPNIGLIISDSDLDDFPNDLLEGFNVSHLALVTSDLTVFPVEFMSTISSDVVYLKLEANNIGDFRWKGHVDRLPFANTLKTLIMQKCDLISLGEGAFSEFGNLQDLDLSDNFISEVPSRAFANHYTLQGIDLSRNLLMSLGKSAFTGLPSLINLDLSLNYIVFIDAGTFVELENLNHLNLFDNEILQLEETTLNKRDVPKLLDLRIAENPFICDCNLQWLKLWFIEHSSLEESGGTCLFPEVAEFGEVDFCPFFTLEFNRTQF